MHLCTALGAHSRGSFDLHPPGSRGKASLPRHCCHLGPDSSPWWGHPGHGRRFSSLPGLYPPGASGILVPRSGPPKVSPETAKEPPVPPPAPHAAPGSRQGGSSYDTDETQTIVETKTWTAVMSSPRSLRESGAGLQTGLRSTQPRERSGSQALLLDSRSF